MKRNTIVNRKILIEAKPNKTYLHQINAVPILLQMIELIWNLSSSDNAIKRSHVKNKNE